MEKTSNVTGVKLQEPYKFDMLQRNQIGILLSLQETSRDAKRSCLSLPRTAEALQASLGDETKSKVVTKSLMSTGLLDSLCANSCPFPY